MELIDIINQIEADKIERGIAPTHATLKELHAEAPNHYGPFYKDIIKEELAELQMKKKIYLGDTLNDKFIKVL